jgi:hypothetical protein
MADFIVGTTTSTRYVDGAGDIVSGYTVYVEFPEFDEVHKFDVPNIRPETINAVASDFLANRRALAELGGESEA